MAGAPHPPPRPPPTGNDLENGQQLPTQHFWGGQVKHLKDPTFVRFDLILQTDFQVESIGQ